MTLSTTLKLSPFAYQELHNFIINTTFPNYSVNNGPFPNTSLQYVETLLLLHRRRNVVSTGGRTPLVAFVPSMHSSELYRSFLI